MRRGRFRLAACAGSALLLASCGAPDEGEGDTDPPASEAPVAEASQAADAELALQGLGPEIATDLGPTLGGCSFEHEGFTLLIAGAPDDYSASGRGVIVIEGGEIALEGQGTGGPEYIDSGPVMTGGGYTVTVERGSGEGEPVGIESTQYPADLVVAGEDGAERRYTNGTWTCGV